MKLRFKILSLLVVISVIISCSELARMSDGAEQLQIGGNGKVSLLFSGNVNGETHPCGCRHFPLGGLDNVAGAFEQVKKKGHHIVYVDAGDHFFPSNNVPSSMRSGFEHTATSLAQALKMLGSSFLLPGDQDYSAGEGYLAMLAQNHQLKFLLTNANETNKLPHRPWARLHFGKARVYMLGLVDPDIMGQEKSTFMPLNEGMEKGLAMIKKDGYDEGNSMHRLLVLSHSGFDRDRELAKKFPQIDWIAGAHTQNFIRIPYEEGKTKIVQVLSRNHYLGEIVFDLNQEKSQDSYQLIEIREELMKELNPNPFTQFINEHKTKLLAIREQEQQVIASAYQSSDIAPVATAASCIECHQEQGAFWSRTPHSLAYLTLVKSQEENNLQCLQCHTLALGQPGGPQKHLDLVQMKLEHKHSKGEEAHAHDYHEMVSADDPEQVKAYQQKMQSYWKEVFAGTPVKESLRKLDGKRIQAGVKHWNKIDKRFGVSANYNNVQCLNCHTKHPDHPFNPSSASPDKPEVKVAQIKAKCLECHDADQSPEWYQRQPSGGEGKLNEAVMQAHYKKLSCPKRKE